MTALLDLVRKLIDYGKELAPTLNQRIVEQPYFAVFNYGTADLTLVLARINRGLLRAIALEERLVRLAARPERKPAPTGSTSQRKPRAARPTVQPAQPADALTHLPTPEEIAAEVRRRPIGAVIADICRDLAILPSHPLWRELQNAIMKHGGGATRLLIEILRRLFPFPAEPETLFLPLPAPACAGPP